MPGMADEPVTAGLLAKRTELEEAVADLEYQVRQKRTQISQLDATLGMFAPGLTQDERRLSIFIRSPHLAAGELTGRGQNALREADGGYVTVEGIVWRATQEKAMDLADADMRDDFARHFTWTLNAMLSQGAVRKGGSGADARWRYRRR